MNRPRFIEFNCDWDKMLKEFRIDKLHMKDFVRPYGKYCTMTGEMKKALFTSVAKWINRYKAYSLAVGIPQADYKSMLSKEVCDDLMGPYAMSFFTIVLSNREASLIRGYNNRIAYLVDKGNDNHHEQLEAAHTVVLHLEKSRGERFTGAMAADLDDNNNALQAADAVAWSYHRQLESGGLDAEYEPLRAIFKESQLPPRPDGGVLRPHITINIPKSGIGIFATLINNWISKHGEIPTWEQLAEGSTMGMSMKNSTGP